MPEPADSHRIELAGRESRCYRVPADQGGRLVVIVPQRGAADIRIESSSGVVIDTPMHYAGDEMWFAAADPAAAWLRLSSKVPPGVTEKYSVQVEMLPVDDVPLASRHGRVLAKLVSGENRVELANELFEIAAGWRTGRRIHWSAVAMHTAGFLWWLTGATEQAVEAMSGAEALYRSASDDKSVAMVLNHHAMLLVDRAKFGEAEALLNRALAIQEKRKYTRGFATTLNNLGLAKHYQGDLDAARALYERAARLNEELNLVHIRLVQLNNLGGIHFVKGEALSAAARFREVIDLGEKIGAYDPWASALGNLALVHSLSGSYLDALTAYMQLLAVCEQEKDQHCIARTLNRLGQTYLALGDPGRALEHLEQARAKRQLLDDRRELAHTLELIAEAWRQLGDLERSRESVRVALELDLQPRQRGKLMMVQAALALEQDDYRRAHRIFTMAGTNLAEAGEPQWAAVARIRAAEATLRAGGSVDENAMRELRPILREAGLVDGEVALHELLARAAFQGDRHASALKELDAAQSLLDAIGNAIPVADLRASFVSTRVALRNLRVDVLMALHERHPHADFPARAMLASDSAKALVISELLRRQNVQVGSSSLVEERERLLERINFRISQQPKDIEGDAELAEWRTRLDVIDAKLARENPHAAPGQADQIELARTRQRMGEGTALIYYHLGEVESYAWVVTADDFVVQRLDALEDIERKVIEVRDAIERRATSPAARRTALQALAEAVVHPVYDAVREYPNWLIVADGALHLAPFAALPAPHGERLVSDHVLRFLPSLGSLSQHHGEHSGEAIEIALIADPVYDASDPRLNAKGHMPGLMQSAGRLGATGREADVIRHLLDDAKVTTYEGFEAQPALLHDPRVASADIVHFAVHGVFDTRTPALSGLLLSRFDSTGRTGNGFVGLREIYSLDWNADLVVLSGCETARGRRLDGVGVVGMTNGFLAAGAAQIVSSLWRVSDSATAEFMKHFYAALEDHPPARALSAAQRAMREDRRWRHPWYWSGFVLHGMGELAGERNRKVKPVAQ